ncbi:hypothetical protein EJV47_09850 [Hymenobacter gummosus]|uniref:Uncharacterized protein n=1 Tax=Hymenobacter gummosus TaxID=1776032 RepID=A0A431U4P3_9BACT|nr:hypothetical protein [Hymenobacter gummosus]RTQ50907.1 hypothetical protein EJV47_09850 [Hymenobacter gummosus]
MRLIFSYIASLLPLVWLHLMPGVVKAQPGLPIHTIKIKDKHVRKGAGNTDKEIFNSVTLENKADNAYVIKIGYGDMGVAFSYGYVLKDSLPDGIYQLVINGTIESETPFINGKKEGVIKEYNHGILKAEIAFKQGIKTGYSRYYKKETSPFTILVYTYNGLDYLNTTLDSNNQVVARVYSVNGLIFRREVKRIPEYKKEIYTDKAFGLEDTWVNVSGMPGRYLSKNDVEAQGGIRNGLYELVTPYGKYQLFFELDTIKWWKWLDKEGKLVIEVHAEPGQRL